MSDQTESSGDGFLVPPFFLHGVTAGFVGTYVVFYLTKDVLLPKLATPSFLEKVAALKTRKETTFFYSTFPSMAHALVQSVFAPMRIALGFSEEHNANRVTYFDDTWPAAFSGIFVGYLLADFFICGPKDLGPAYVVHHLAAIVTWTWTACVGAMQWYASLLQFCEFSTIAMNVRQWVLTAGYSSGSSVVLGVSMVFFASFIAVRVVPLPKLAYQWVTNDYSQLSAEKGTPVALLSTTSLTIHILLQSFWFFLMVKKIAKLVLGGSKKPKKEK